MKNIYVADTESTTDEKNCFVWGYAVCEVGNIDNVIIGNRLDDFMKWCEKQPDNITVLFCNLKWDSQFILSWLLKNGYKHVTRSIERKTKTFTTLITNKGLYYCIEVVFFMKGKRIKKVTFLDSYKLIPLSVKGIAEAFNLPFKKLNIDYHRHNNLPEGAPLSEDEKKYITHDVKIVAYGVEYFYNNGLDKMTIGSCAMKEYKKIVTKRSFERWFPRFTAEYHNDVKQAYRGGFSMVNPKFAGKQVGGGLVLDMNSIYSYVMANKMLPYGTPIFYRGQYKEDSLYPLYTQMIQCQFKLKPGKIPTIQAKYSFKFSTTEYLTTTNDEEITLCLNSIDLKLLFENYEVYNPVYLGGWKYKAGDYFFKEYVEKWSAIKIQAKNENNPGMYLISKLFLNSLYGKFGTDVKIGFKIPHLDKNGVVDFYDSEPEEKPGVYIAMASFITSYARDITIRASQKIMDDYNAGKSDIQWLYSDTDSLHILTENYELPEGLEIDNTKLGAWKVEGVFDKAKFLRSKCYIERLLISENEYIRGMEGEEPYLYSIEGEQHYKMKITVAGMPSECYPDVNFKNFKIGAKFKGKKQPRIVAGGVILEDVDFTIKQ